MKNYFKLTCVAIAIMVGNILNAQPPGGQQGRQQGPPPLPNQQQIEQMVSNLASELSLSESQESKMLDLYTEHFKAVELKTSQGRPDRDEMEALKTEFEKEVNSILTSDQKALYAKYNANNKRPPNRQ